MCNCAAQVDTYNAFNSAVADCSAYNGAGAGSCVANVLGHVSLLKRVIINQNYPNFNLI